jgi:hypothetical protein
VKRPASDDEDETKKGGDGQNGGAGTYRGVEFG